MKHVPAHITSTQVEALRKRLVDRAQVLMAELEMELHAGGLAVDARNRDTDDIEASVTAAAAQRDSDELRAIDQALARMRAGTYGLCAACGSPLPWVRLDAVPEAKRCLACETAHERHANPASL